MCSRRGGRRTGVTARTRTGLQHYYQFQVILKPSPENLAGSLPRLACSAIGVDHGAARRALRRRRLGEPDARRLGPRLGMLVRRHGSLAIHVLSAGRGLRVLARVGRTDLWAGTARHVCAGRRERVYDLNFNGRDGAERISYGDVFLQAEQEYSRFNFEHANTSRQFCSSTSRTPRPSAERCSGKGEAGEKHLMALPAYDQCIKASHAFNLLDARGVISVTERQSYILRVRELAKACGAAWLEDGRREGERRKPSNPAGFARQPSPASGRRDCAPLLLARGRGPALRGSHGSQKL